MLQTKREQVAVVYPEGKSTLVQRLAGKYRYQVQAVADIETALTEGMMKAMAEKYGSCRNCSAPNGNHAVENGLATPPGSTGEQNRQKTVGDLTSCTPTDE